MFLVIGLPIILSVTGGSSNSNNNAPVNPSQGNSTNSTLNNTNSSKYLFI